MKIKDLDGIITLKIYDKFFSFVTLYYVTNQGILEYAKKINPIGMSTVYGEKDVIRIQAINNEIYIQTNEG